MLCPLWLNSGNSSSIWHRLLLILLVLQLGTQEAVTGASSVLDGAKQQLRVDSGQSSTSWFNFNGHWPLGDDSDGTCQPPILWAPVKGNGNSSIVPKNQGSPARQTQEGAASPGGSSGAPGSSGRGNTGSKVAQGRSSGTTTNERQLNENFTCKDHNNQVVSWFIVIKEHRSYNYVFATSESQAFSGLESNIHNSGPLYNTLQQTRQHKRSLLFYSYTSNKTRQDEGHQNGVLLFGKNRGFWLIHSWRLLFNYFWDKDFRFPEDTNGQAFLCTTHRSGLDLDLDLDLDLENIAKQLFISKPHPTSSTHVYLNPKFAVKSNWSRIVKRESVTETRVSDLCEGNPSCKQKFTIEGGFQLIHFSKSRFDATDIYDWIARQIGIRRNSSRLMVQSWRSPPTVNQAILVRNVESHTYPPMQEAMTSTTDHSKWCVPVVPANSDVDLDEILKFVCIGDLNRDGTTRPGGAMCLWNVAIWEYFKNVT